MRLAVIAATMLMAGCAITNETAVMVGQARTPTEPETVKLYTQPPKKYVDIAIISADAAHDFMTKQALMDKAVQNAKIQAAKVGANGILLNNLGDLQLGASGVILPPSSGGFFASGNRTGKQLTGKAIYVIED